MIFSGQSTTERCRSSSGPRFAKSGDELPVDLIDHLRPVLAAGDQVGLAADHRRGVDRHPVLQRQVGLHAAARLAEEEDVAQVHVAERPGQRQEVQHVVDLGAAELLPAIAAGSTPRYWEAITTKPFET